jgi:acetate kinase
LKRLQEDKSAVLKGTSEIDVVGHRVVHGGVDFAKAVVVDARVESVIERLAAFAPLHNPVNLEGIRVAREVLGSEIPQIAVFDTSFHRTLTQAAETYPGPYDWLKKGIRRYGFHGTSFRWASGQAARLLKREERSFVAIDYLPFGRRMFAGRHDWREKCRYHDGLYAHGRNRHVHALWGT